jgi:ABC-type multidrug transport system fused ATPase/permease subunit
MKKLKKIYYIITILEKKKFFLLLLLIMTMAFIDTLGVASILPFIAILGNPQLIESNQVINYFYQLLSIFGVTKLEEFILLFGVIVLVIIICSLILRSFTSYFQSLFTLMQEFILSKRLVEGYLNQPYEWFINQQSANLGKNILSEVGLVVEKCIYPFINIIVYGALSAALLTLLIYVNFKVALIIGFVLFFFYFIFFYLIKKFLSRASSDRFQANEVRFVTIYEIFNALKEIKIGGLNKIYIDRFKDSSKIYAHATARAQIIGFLPRYLIEGIAFTGIIIFVLFLVNYGNSFYEIIPLLTLYVFAAYRLIPAFQQVYIAFSQIRFSGESLDVLYRDLQQLKDLKIISSSSSSSIRFKKSIILDNVNFNYPNIQHKTLKNINLTIPAFSKVGIVGVTGAGKSTLVSIILGLLNPSKGNITVDGKTITYSNKRSWHKNIGYVPQQIYLSNATIASNIAFGEDVCNINQKRVEQVAKIANLHDFVTKESPDSYNTIIGDKGVKLSGGQRQRIGIARALYYKPRVLILDEATSSLDNFTEQKIMEAIEKLKGIISIILIAHRFSTVKNCDKIFYLEKGQVIDTGTYDDLLVKNNKFKKMTLIKF